MNFLTLFALQCALTLCGAGPSSGAGGGGSFTAGTIQHTKFFCASSPCTVDATHGALATIGAGHLLIVNVGLKETGAASTLLSVAGVGATETFTYCWSCYQAGPDHASNLTAFLISSTAGATGLTATLSGGGGPTGVTVEVIEKAYSGGVPILDAGNGAQSASCTTACPGAAAMTLTGTTDYLMQSIAVGPFTATAVGAISGGAFTTPDFTDTDTNLPSGVAAVSGTNGAQPTWATSGGTGQVASGGLCIGFGATPCQDVTLFNGAGLTNGVQETNASIGNSLVGEPMTVGQTGAGTINGSNAVSLPSISTQRACLSGTSVPGTGLVTDYLGTTASTHYNLTPKVPHSTTTWSVATWFDMTWAQNSAVNSQISGPSTIESANGVDTVNLALKATGTTWTACLEISGSCGATFIASVASNTIMRVDILFDEAGGTHRINVWSSNCTNLGSSSGAAGVGNTLSGGIIAFGHTGAEAVPTGDFYIRPAIIDTSGTWPLPCTAGTSGP